MTISSGCSFNLDAFSIYISLAAVFIVRATNTPISMTDLQTIPAISLVASRGAHGVPGPAIDVLEGLPVPVPEDDADAADTPVPAWH